jgi:hypothetical protein
MNLNDANLGAVLVHLFIERRTGDRDVISVLHVNLRCRSPHPAAASIAERRQRAHWQAHNAGAWACRCRNSTSTLITLS